jgi:hypothetical protein
VVTGRGGMFSLEGPEGLRFLTRSRLFTDEENAELTVPAPGRRRIRDARRLPSTRWSR